MSEKFISVSLWLLILFYTTYPNFTHLARVRSMLYLLFSDLLREYYSHHTFCIYPLSMLFGKLVYGL